MRRRAQRHTPAPQPRRRPDPRYGPGSLGRGPRGARVNAAALIPAHLFENASSAGVYEHLVGGCETYAPNRAAAVDAGAAARSLVAAAWINRAFLTASVQYSPGLGVSQFLDLGCGYPGLDILYDATRRAIGPAAPVVYVDHDPRVFAHARTTLEDGPGAVSVHADILDMSRLLADRRGHDGPHDVEWDPLTQAHAELLTHALARPAPAESQSPSRLPGDASTAVVASGPPSPPPAGSSGTDAPYRLRGCPQGRPGPPGPGADPSPAEPGSTSGPARSPDPQRPRHSTEAGGTPIEQLLTRARLSRAARPLPDRPDYPSVPMPLEGPVQPDAERRDV
ncbi:SAM-dependent methyltransferase [Streptomyces sp. NPDC059819]|uniref:SAM-dependent methyltransferase n=1 Tax=Streptomyces sp. NPDC059819 TaxID=3346963 RepID=UPI0036532AE8